VQAKAAVRLLQAQNALQAALLDALRAAAVYASRLFEAYLLRCTDRCVYVCVHTHCALLRSPLQGKWQKFIDFKWEDVKPVDLLKITRLEAQVRSVALQSIPYIHNT
jgi:hypothetical protein